MLLNIGSDHAGFGLKEKIIEHLRKLGHVVTDRGSYSEASTDYPPYAHSVAIDVTKGTCDFGILICGSANGVCMTANKHSGIRAALCWLPEIAVLARQHNDANILCLPARYLDVETAVNCVDNFIGTAFEGGRHQTRVDKINCA